MSQTELHFVPDPAVKDVYISTGTGTGLEFSQTANTSCHLDVDCPICSLPLTLSISDSASSSGYTPGTGTLMIDPSKSMSTHSTCNNKFHTACLDDWDKAQHEAFQATTCPFCRGVLRE
ncbi:hypothetical protein PMZ80_006794 [Knufia obscura]|uniref:RING-type domain-containing protein n=1 Tax=Knufia obscura TaxID=1635080 RepID=A0ABR0RLP0_9EURO|nr:hypothetical protein PMZ80_006794 [Knufia obscura]